MKDPNDNHRFTQDVPGGATLCNYKDCDAIKYKGGNWDKPCNDPKAKEKCHCCGGDR